MGSWQILLRIAWLLGGGFGLCFRLLCLFLISILRKKSGQDLSHKKLKMFVKLPSGDSVSRSATSFSVGIERFMDMFSHRTSEDVISSFCCCC